MKVDVNLLPEEHRPKRWALPLTAGLVIVILAVGYFGYGFYTRNAAANDEIEDLQTMLAQINAETQRVINESPIADYQEQIAQTETEIADLEAKEKDYETRNAERIYWKPVIQTIRELSPTDITILSFNQNDDEIVIEGELDSEIDNTIIIVEYAQKLQERGIFSRLDYEFDTAERTVGEGEDTETEEFYIFTMLLQVKLGGTQ